MSDQAETIAPQAGDPVEDLFDRVGVKVKKKAQISELRKMLMTGAGGLAGQGIARLAGAGWLGIGLAALAGAAAGHLASSYDFDTGGLGDGLFGDRDRDGEESDEDH